nr:HAMP domain-containing sensor histidine kinase [uncultured Flavobacterium sp.]
MHHTFSRNNRVNLNVWKTQKIQTDKTMLFRDEQTDLENTEKALINILEDYSEEKNYAEDTQRALLNILDDYTDEKRKSNEQATALIVQNTQLIDFCSIVSHNLRAPIINIHMLIDFIEQSNDESERKEVLDKIKHVVTHLNDVFDELVESIQIKQDTEIKSERIHLIRCLNKVLTNFESQVEQYGADIQIDFRDAPTIYFPQKYIDSIFNNLISNALKYKSPDIKPVIKIKTENKNGNILLSVSDNGLGIDLKLHKDNLFKIRKVFHKHPDARGFGLFMTKTQVEAMGGKIWVESTPDEGSTFFIEFKNQT